MRVTDQSPFVDVLVIVLEQWIEPVGVTVTVGKFHGAGGKPDSMRVGPHLHDPRLSLRR